MYTSRTSGLPTPRMDADESIPLQGLRIHARLRHRFVAAVRRPGSSSRTREQRSRRTYESTRRWNVQNPSDIPPTIDGKGPRRTQEHPRRTLAGVVRDRRRAAPPHIAARRRPGGPATLVLANSHDTLAAHRHTRTRQLHGFRRLFDLPIADEPDARTSRRWHGC